METNLFDEEPDYELTSEEPWASVSSENTTSPTFLYYGPFVVGILTFVLSTIMLMSIFGNLLVITTILRNRSMRTRTNLLLCNLALADILVGVFDVPIAIVTLNVGDWPFTEAMCKFNAYMVGMGIMLSLHTLMYISIHKFFSIKNIFRAGLSLRTIYLMVASAWAWAFFYNTFSILGWTQEKYKKGASQCGPVRPRSALQISHSVVNKFCNFIVPLCVITVFYYKIFALVREHLSRLDDLSDVRMKNSLIQQKRILKTLVIVLVCFVLCYTPYIAYSSSIVFHGEENVAPIFNPLGYLFMYLNSACNPIIYSLMFPKFRKGFKDIICGQKHKNGLGDESGENGRLGFLVSSFRQSMKKTRSHPELTQRSRQRNKRMSQPQIKKHIYERNAKLRRLNTAPPIRRSRTESIISEKNYLLEPTKKHSIVDTLTPQERKMSSISTTGSVDIPVRRIDELNEPEEENLTTDSISQETNVRGYLNRQQSASVPNLICVIDEYDGGSIRDTLSPAISAENVLNKSISHDNIYYQRHPTAVIKVPSLKRVGQDEQIQEDLLSPPLNQTQRGSKGRLSLANIFTSLKRSFTDLFPASSLDEPEDDLGESFSENLLLSPEATSGGVPPSPLLELEGTPRF